MKTALSIAGSDPSGGAGIQADIKTMTAHGVYAMSVITSLTSQNTLGVREIFTPPAEFLKSQLEAVLEDIFPDAVKTGMIPSPALIRITAETLKKYSAKNIVADPVMVSTSGSRLMEKEAVAAIKKYLFPISALITPNIPEAETLTGIKITDMEGMLKAAKMLFEECGCAVLIKGGHGTAAADDMLYEKGSAVCFPGKRIPSSNTHGTGCTLSPAIASSLAKGLELADAAAAAKEYITGAIASGLDLGRGNGPTNHMFDLKSTFIQRIQRRL